MFKQPPIFLAFGLVAVIVICSTVLASTHVDIPGFFSTVALVAVGGGAGTAVPQTVVRSQRSTDEPPQIVNGPHE